MNICDARPTELTEEMKRFGVKLDDFGVYFSCGFDVGRTEEKTLTLKGFGNSCIFFIP